MNGSARRGLGKRGLGFQPDNKTLTGWKPVPLAFFLAMTATLHAVEQAGDIQEESQPGAEKTEPTALAAAVEAADVAPGRPAASAVGSHDVRLSPSQHRALLYADLKAAGFKDFKRLKDDERVAFYEAYPADKEMLSRTTLGPIDAQPPRECIAGEAPSLADAKERFPLHYPMMGRMKATEGVFEWMDKRLVFRTEKQMYYVDEYHILYRLERLGLKNQDAGSRPAKINAVWMVNTLDGLRVIYMQKVELL